MSSPGDKGTERTMPLPRPRDLKQSGDTLEYTISFDKTRDTLVRRRSSPNITLWSITRAPAVACSLDEARLVLTLPEGQFFARRPIEVVVQSGAAFALFFARNDDAPHSPIVGVTPAGLIAWQLAEAYLSMVPVKDTDAIQAAHEDGEMHIISAVTGAIIRVYRD